MPPTASEHREQWLWLRKLTLKMRLPDRSGSEVEYLLRGRQMVRELESFLRAELAHPREGRRISFLAAPSNGSVSSRSDGEPGQGMKPC